MEPDLIAHLMCASSADCNTLGDVGGVGSFTSIMIHDVVVLRPSHIPPES